MSSFGDALGGVFDPLGIGGSLFGGGGGGDSSAEAARIQDQASRRAIRFQRETRDLARADLAPFREFGQGQLGALESILTPEGQMAYLESNPLFALGQENLNQQTANLAASQGRLNSGGTWQSLYNNALLAGQPLLQNQTTNLFNAANLGQSAAAGQANTAIATGQNISDLYTQQGNAQAAGVIGQANAEQQQFNNLLNLGSTALAGFALLSDRRFKVDIEKIGEEKGLPVYSYRYLGGSEIHQGFMADEVKAKYPHAVKTKGGVDFVNYAEIA